MANYYASCRSNYFKVKDEDKFREYFSKVSGIEIHDRSDGSFCLLGCDIDGGGWPSVYYDEEQEDYIEYDFMDGIAEFLAEGEVAIFMEVGAEKLRYLVGYAYAVAWTGETMGVSIDDIYAQATDKFVGCNTITGCEY